MERFLQTETLIIELLLIVSLVAIGVRRLRVPYTVALVVVGLVITFNHPISIDLTPELILALFVPPLIFEAAFHLEFRLLRENLIHILVLSVPGVLLTTAVVGLVITLGTGLSLSSALLFGALIAATAPVAVVALFRAPGAPKRLTVLVEGESLFNGGTAIVIYKLVPASALSVAASSDGQAEGFSFAGAVVDFVRVYAGGAIIGVGSRPRIASHHDLWRSLIYAAGPGNNDEVAAKPPRLDSSRRGGTVAGAPPGTSDARTRRA